MTSGHRRSLLPDQHFICDLDDPIAKEQRHSVRDWIRRQDIPALLHLEASQDHPPSWRIVCQHAIQLVVSMDVQCGIVRVHDFDEVVSISERPGDAILATDPVELAAIEGICDRGQFGACVLRSSGVRPEAKRGTQIAAVRADYRSARSLFGVLLSTQLIVG